MTEEYKNRLKELNKPQSVSIIKAAVKANEMTPWRRSKLLFFAKLANRVMGVIVYLSEGSVARLFMLKIYAYLEKKRAALRHKPIIFNGQVQNVADILDIERQMNEDKKKLEELREDISNFQKDQNTQPVLFQNKEKEDENWLEGEREEFELALKAYEKHQDKETKRISDEKELAQKWLDKNKKRVGKLDQAARDHLYNTLDIPSPNKPIKTSDLPPRPWNCAVPVETDVTGTVLEEFLSDEDFKEIKPRKRSVKKKSKVAKKPVNAKKSIKKGKKK
jgi:hypothetical protein